MVARDKEVREHHRVDRVRVEQDARVARRREAGAHVEQADLDREEEAEDEERAPLVPRDAQRPGRRRYRGPDEYGDAAHEEAQAGEPDRRRVDEADLDRDGVRAPENGEAEREQRGPEVEGPQRWQGVYSLGMKIGLIGLPKSGKTTLFNLLTGSRVATARFDAGKAELHTGVARVPDPRVDRLSVIFKPKKTTYATFEVVDLAGIERGERAGLD